MSISLNGIKMVFTSIWKSLPIEIVVMIIFLVSLSQLDFLPNPVLQVLASMTSIASFSMLFFRMYNSVAHDYIVSKAVRLAEKKYITNRYDKCRAEYIVHIKNKKQTIVQSISESLKKENSIDNSVENIQERKQGS